MKVSRTEAPWIIIIIIIFCRHWAVAQILRYVALAAKGALSMAGPGADPAADRGELPAGAA